jgi:hydroxymethylglutaryl-CoA lyase
MTQILISEVGPRDGLQSTQRIMSLEAKKAWIKAEAEAGVREIEVGSFVPPALLPQLADTAEVVAFAKTIPNLNVVALVPNAKGAARAAEARVHGMSIPFSMSETHSLKNVRKSHPEMVEEIRKVAEIARSANIHFAVGLSTAFGCTMEGAVPEDSPRPPQKQARRNSACQTQPATPTRRRSNGLSRKSGQRWVLTR